MSELQAEYDIQQEVSEAMDMLGKGYEEEQQIVDESDLRKYRIELPNLYDDSDLDPYEFRLLAHYKRVGRCTEGIRTTAMKCKMSVGQVSEKRISLEAKGFISVKEVSVKTGKSYIVTVIDRWKENFEKYSQCSLSEQGVHLVNKGVHQVKQRINNIKKKPKKEVNKAATPQPPEIILFKELVNHYPKQNQREIVIDSIQKINVRLGRVATLEDLSPFWKEWARVSGNEWSLVWLDEWAVSGQVKNGNGKKHTPAPVAPTESPEDLEARRAEADRLFGVVK